MNRLLFLSALLTSIVSLTDVAQAQDGPCEGMLVMTEQARQDRSFLPELVRDAVNETGGSLAGTDRLSSYLAFNDKTAAELVAADAGDLEGIAAELGVTWVVLVQTRPDKERPKVFHTKVSVLPSGTGSYKTFDGMEDPGQFKKELKELLGRQFASACKQADSQEVADAQTRPPARQPTPDTSRAEAPTTAPQPEPEPEPEPVQEPTRSNPAPMPRENPSQVTYLPQKCEANADCADWSKCSPIENLCYVRRGRNIPVDEVETDFVDTARLAGVAYVGDAALYGAGFAVEAPLVSLRPLTLVGDIHVVFGGNDVASVLMGSWGLGFGYRFFDNGTMNASVIAMPAAKLVQIDSDVFSQEEWLFDGYTGLRFNWGVLSLEADVALRGPTLFLQTGFAFGWSTVPAEEYDL